MRTCSWLTSRSSPALHSLLLETLHLVGDAEQGLHVMADLVRDHVGLGEVARCLEAVLQLPVEVEVDVDLVIERAIERPHRRLAGAARRLRGALNSTSVGFS